MQEVDLPVKVLGRIEWDEAGDGRVPMLAHDADAAGTWQGHE